MTTVTPFLPGENASISNVIQMMQTHTALSLVPRPSPLSAHYTRASCAHADSYARGAHNCPHAHNSPAYNERLAGKAWERGYTALMTFDMLAFSPWREYQHIKCHSQTHTALNAHSLLLTRLPQALPSRCIYIVTHRKL